MTIRGFLISLALGILGGLFGAFLVFAADGTLAANPLKPPQPPKPITIKDITLHQAHIERKWPNDVHVEGLQRDTVVVKDYFYTLSRFHDMESGVEFICAYNMGCVLTGRRWQ